MREQWRAVQGFEGRYSVSDQGRVRSEDHWDGRRNVTGRILRPGRSNSGHVSVAIGRGNSRLVHQLVLEAFVGPRPPRHEVMHKNGRPADNRLANLKYGTRSENLKHDYASGVRQVALNWVYSPNGQRKKTADFYRSTRA